LREKPGVKAFAAGYVDNRLACGVADKFHQSEGFNMGSPMLLF